MAYQMKVKIGYASGQVEEFWYDSFELKRQGTDIVSIVAKMSDPGQKPLVFGIDNIVYAYQTEVREVPDQPVEESAGE